MLLNIVHYIIMIVIIIAIVITIATTYGIFANQPKWIYSRLLAT